MGAGNYINEVSWLRSQTRSSISRRYRRAHDTILFYGKGPKYQFNLAYKDLSEASLEIYSKHDEKGRYRLVPLLVSGKRNGETGRVWRGVDPNQRGKNGMHWVTTPAKLVVYEKEELLVWPKKKGGAPQLKYYLDDNPGVPVNDFWDDVAFMPSQSTENLGYPTQKPLALLARIIQASSNEGELVLDPFCGCGTAADAAAKLGRGYLGIDVSAIAVRVMEQRLASRGGKAIPLVHKMGWEDYEWEAFERRALMREADAEDGLPGWAWAEDKVAGLLNAVPNSKKIGDGGVDARYFTGGGEVIPIQVKMHQGQIGRPQLQNLLGVQAEWQNKQCQGPYDYHGDALPAQRAVAGICPPARGRNPTRGTIPEDAGIERPRDAYQAIPPQATAGRPPVFRGRHANALRYGAVGSTQCQNGRKS